MMGLVGALGLLAALLIGFGSFILACKGKKGSLVFNVMILLLAGNSLLNIITATGG